MWKQFQNFMRKYRLAIGRYIWDRKLHKEHIIEGNFIENNGIRSIVFLRQDGKVGDMVVHTMIFRAIKEQYPNIKIGVITKGAARGIIENNSNVDKIYQFEKEKSKIKKLARQISEEKYDLLVDFSIMLRVRDMMLISLCKARYTIGVNREDWKLFDLNVSFDFHSHITDLYGAFLTKIGVKYHSTKYEIFSEALKLETQNRVIVLNPYASNRHRSLSDEMVVKIGREMLQYKKIEIYIVGESSKKTSLTEIARNIGEKAKYYPTKSILDLVSLIQRADLIVSPDTAAVHIASAFDKKIISVYLEDNEEIYYAKMWAPNSSQAKIIYANHENMDWFAWEEMERYLRMMLEGEKNESKV
ncbi:LOS biosynthesis enzyme LBGB [Fusobacterium necrophorum subsp. funduliforme]|mgnify:FL=1|uniref:Heptosyltransferase n=2 Tax=Fusobacterium necrophorum TaxID=859 RepID=A0AAN4AT10_9FUSO|nr:glycosyltransferase family 9 protein [Fusobacterium necrophorum]AYV94484.1 lipopolysaccharide heptosyltransferase family protein [Fusobacterium necrophorum subsp. funduliforme]EJU17583.1 heptosyltransferase [Fusobacterium necrophorum subsp. funduliforme Fnf 1007]KYL02587.1 LOS biosynthesis enzyme LBGB [Fusobacterium necrophorum subsp. funduliforme]KYL04167.1 LOS biosynthesis enzyme LBGB [Fusobacterium necrophorum subsp. funduliforme]KYM39979.1 LOS biosynthesis enzyme LBGB [Fusobacterium nec